MLKNFENFLTEKTHMNHNDILWVEYSQDLDDIFAANWSCTAKITSLVWFYKMINHKIDKPKRLSIDSHFQQLLGKEHIISK